jgi:hypothetical protein|tara:strand:- start:1501 stop:1761 length:261 start_codon:yes stop_codon:yes gene_type:complete
MSPKEKAAQLLSSHRGGFLVNQAFHYAIKALESVEPSYLKEESNIADMKLLRKEIFNQYPAEVFEPMRIHVEGDIDIDSFGDKIDA